MKSTLARMLFLACGIEGYSYATQLIVNGGFETGNLSGWTVTSEAASFTGSSFYASNSTTTPQSGLASVGPGSGTYYAVSDGGGSAAVVLSQSFVVPKGEASVILSYDMFVNSGISGPPTPASVNTSAGLDFNQIPSQFGIVSLMTGTGNLFSTTTGDLKDFYEGVDTKNNPNHYTSYSFDITSLVSGGGTFTLRFAEVNNLDFLNLGVDNVSVNANATSTPEPASILLAVLGLAGFGVRRARRP
jgi:MYXO-CTERM domain-containing protein